MKAAQKGYLNIMQQLIRAGANVNLQDSNKGRTALHWIQRMREGATVKSGNQMTKERALQAMNLLLQAGADPTIKDKVTSDNPVAYSVIEWSIIKSPWQGKQEEIGLLLNPQFVTITFNGPAYNPTGSSSSAPPVSSSSHVSNSEKDDRVEALALAWSKGDDKTQDAVMEAIIDENLVDIIKEKAAQGIEKYIKLVEESGM